MLICWLALLLIRVAENHTATTWTRISRELDRLAAVTLAGPAGTVVQTTEPTTNAPFSAPARCPYRPGSPRYTLADLRRHIAGTHPEAWTHALTGVHPETSP
jgi:hypothetical protein